MYKTGYLHNDAVHVYLALDGFDPDGVEENVAFVVTGEGKDARFLFRRTSIATILVPVDKFDGSAKVEEIASYTGAKIPVSLVRQAEDYFRKAYAKQKSEAAVVLYYRKADGNWVADCPVQTATEHGLHVNYDKRQNQDLVNAGYEQAATIHSHANAPAGHSSTDTKDEEYFDGIHITIGNVDRPTPDYSYSCMFHKKRYGVKPDMIIDGGVAESCPPEWLDKLSKETYSGFYYQGGTPHVPAGPHSQPHSHSPYPFKGRDYDQYGYRRNPPIGQPSAEAKAAEAKEDDALLLGDDDDRDARAYGTYESMYLTY